MIVDKHLAIILAGGEGKELWSIARRVAGPEVPKQYCPIVGDITLLEQTRRRLAVGFSNQSVLTVVTRKHKRFYEAALSDVSPTRLIVQPRDRGTAPAILYALFRSEKLVPDPTVAVFPSEHYVEDGAAFVRHVGLAFESIKKRPELLVLLGATPDSPDTDYCWLEPGKRIVEFLRLFELHGVWNRPSRSLAKTLWQSGCLSSTSVLVGQVRVLLSLIGMYFPQLSTSFEHLSSVLGIESEKERVEEIYRTISHQDLLNKVSGNCPGNLAVLPVAGVDWNELRKPERVMTALGRLGIRPQWVHDLRAPLVKKNDGI